VSKLKILVEGWRFSPTSLAVLNMYQLIELSKEPGIELFHRDLPFYNNRFEPRYGLWPAEDEQRVANIPEPTEEMRFDATLRITFPMQIAPCPQSKRTFFLSLAEYGIIEDVKCGGQPAAQALRTPGVEFITSSEFSRQGFIRSGASPENIHVIPLGIDPAMMRPIDERVRQRLRAARGWDEHFVVLNISTLSINKGITQLLSGFAKIAPKYPQALLVIKGNSRLNGSENALRAAFAKLPPELAENIADRIVYLGDVLGFEEMAALYQCADLYAAPYIAEGFNLPVLEAAACGAPVICTAGGPTDEFTTDDFCRRIPSQECSNNQIQEALGVGARILLPDTDQFAALLATAIEDRSWRKRARQAGPEHVCGRFTWAQTTKRLMDIMSK
jgi:glycosyltransferase involved in cell wall biosynthesis